MVTSGEFRNPSTTTLLTLEDKSMAGSNCALKITESRASDQNAIEYSVGTYTETDLKKLALLPGIALFCG